MLTLDELKKKLEAEQKALKDKYAEKLAAAQKREQKAKAREMKKNRAIENHAKYIIAGEFLASPDAKLFLENLSKTKKFSARSALGLNLLMAELGFNIKFLSAD